MTRKKILSGQDGDKMPIAPKEFFLMHKDIPVALLELTPEGGVEKIRKIEANKQHFPVGGQMNDNCFREWWKMRAIPKGRHGILTALEKLGYSSIENAMIDHLALSLTDCYWICPRGERIAWKDVSLFSNDFVDSFGAISMDQESQIDLRENTRFSCVSSQGLLSKKWGIDEEGHRILIKGNTGISYQQSINEVFASSLHEKQGFKLYTPYSLVLLKTDHKGEGLGCMCRDFCSEHLESVSAWELLQTVKYRKDESLYYPFVSACLSTGIKEGQVNGFLDYLIMTDFLLTNTDRHMNNIALLRDPDSLQYVGFAPIFDTGNSMFFDVPYDALCFEILENISVNSFLKKEAKLLSYVHDRSLVSIDLAELDFSIFEKDISERRNRVPKLKALYERKLELLHEFQQGKDIWRNKRYVAKKAQANP